jgi:hypothetical protein
MFSKELYNQILDIIFLLYISSNLNHKYTKIYLIQYFQILLPNINL